jgi:CSLREA domain-containing protein
VQFVSPDSNMKMPLGQDETRASRFIMAAVMAVAFVLVLRPPTRATTYTVNTLDDSNGNSDCSLRDTINAASGTPHIRVNLH